MPKRSTDFQDLISLLERQLAPQGAVVTSSKLLEDSRTGEPREVDIVIETISGIHPFTIGIEVTEQKRPATSTWIEGIAKKHEDLPINKTIVVSLSGFYKPALIKSYAYKIDAYSLRDATSLDWKSIIDEIPSIIMESFLIPYLTDAIVGFADKTSLKVFDGIDFSSLELFNPSGLARGSLSSILNREISSPEFINQIEDKAFVDSGTIVEGRLHFKNGAYILDSKNNKHKVDLIQFRMKCRKEIVDTKTLKGRYGDVAVVMGSGGSFNHKTQIVISEKENEPPVIAVNIKKTKKKNN